jgi:hypothetical protein
MEVRERHAQDLSYVNRSRSERDLAAISRKRMIVSTHRCVQRRGSFRVAARKNDVESVPEIPPGGWRHGPIR